MNKSVLALTVLVAIASFVPAAQAGPLCVDEDGDIEICVKRIPSFIPRSLPEVPKIGPGSVERKVEKLVDPGVVVSTIAPTSTPSAADPDVKIAEKPAKLGGPDVMQLCKKYFPSLGEMLPIACE
jgi:hypothetical protein